MIVEMRTYLLRPGSVQATEDLFRDHLPHRTHLSAMGGLWHTLSGPLDTIVHFWPYASIEERNRIRHEMVRPGKWPPPLRPHLVEMDSAIVLPAPFSPPMVPARLGGLYEFCFDTYLPGGPAACQQAWADAIQARNAISPLVFCGTTEFGKLNQWVHVWAYRDAAHRDEVQARLAAEGVWPPAGGAEFLRRRESFLAAPAECSDLQ